MPLYINGTGSSLGDTLALAEPLQTSASILYVHHSNTSGTYIGTPEQPYATLETAEAAAVNGSIIVLMDGHTETVDDVTINTEVTVVGAGLSGGLPTVLLSSAVGAQTSFQIAANNVQFRNIRFPKRELTSGQNRIYGTGLTGFSMRGCYMERSLTDEGSFLELNACIATKLDSCSLVSVALAGTTTGAVPMLFTGLSPGLTMDGCVFDGGAYGFPSGIALQMGTAEQMYMTGLRVLNTSLLRGSDVEIVGAQGFFHVGVATGSSRVNWT